MQPGPAIRLDKWLWHARLCKTRGLAARLVAAGAVRVNAERALKPATPLRVGDGVTVRQGQVVRVLRVRGLGSRRGPAPEARALYDELAVPEPAPEPASDRAPEPAEEPAANGSAGLPDRAPLEPPRPADT